RHLHSFPTRRSSDLNESPASPTETCTSIPGVYCSPFSLRSLTTSDTIDNLFQVGLDNDTTHNHLSQDGMQCLETKDEVQFADVRSEEHTSELQSRSD